MSAKPERVAFPKPQRQGRVFRLQRNPYLFTVTKLPAGKMEVPNLSALPTPAEYNEILKKHYTKYATALVEDASSELRSLADELGDWRGNLPESFQNSDKGTAIEEAQQSLEGVADNLDGLDWPEKAGLVATFHLTDEWADSRPKRLTEAINKLRSAASALQNHEPEVKEETKQEDPEMDPETDFNDIGSEIDSQADEAESVEIPGMYG